MRAMFGYAELQKKDGAHSRKGFIEIPILAVIATIVVITIVLFALLVKIHIVRTVNMEYQYSNAELSLLTLLSDKVLYEKLSLYAAGLPYEPGKFARLGAVTDLENALDKIVASKCYELSYDSIAIIDKTGQTINGEKCSPESKATSLLVLPGLQTTQIELMIK